MWSALFHGEAFPGRSFDRQGFAGAVFAVVNEGAHRCEAVATLEGRLGALFVRVGGHQRRVDVHNHLPTRPLAGAAGHRAPARPRRGPSLCPRPADRGDGIVNVAGQRCEQSRHGRVGGNRPEDRRLGADRGDVGQAVTAERDRRREVEKNLARVMLGSDRPPPRHRRRKTTVQARDPDRFTKQQRPR